MNQIGLMKAYLNLTALQKKVPKAYEVKEHYVREYNSILEDLAKASGHNLDDFRVPEAEIHQKFPTFSFDPYAGDDSQVIENYAPGLYCERAILMKKLGTILKYFDVTTTGGKPQVAFRMPNQ